MSIDLSAARSTFLEEADELLREMEAILLACEHEEADEESIHHLFRAAHTIKGSAGLFGFQAVVDFTHGMESLLEHLRAGVLTMDQILPGLLLECGDHLQALIGAAADETSLDAASMQHGAELSQRLRAYLGEIADATGSSVTESATVIEAAPQESTSTVNGADCWHLSLRFDAEVLRMGLDPLSFIRYLTTVGEIRRLEVLAERLPELIDHDAEACYLGFEISLMSAASRAEIEDVFEFVHEDAQIHLIPPRARVEEYLALIETLPDDAARLGEMLVAAEAITRHELDKALARQEANKTQAHAPLLGEILCEQGVVTDQVVAAALDKQKRAEERRASEARSVKVPADKLDHLIDLVGELAIAGGGTQLLASRSRRNELIESASQVVRLVEEVRDAALRLRMVQIGEIFSRFPRVVRDLSRELDKQVELRLSGAETELDKSIVERIGDPLMHLVRNALDHGLEATAERRAAGKPERGVLHLAARHESGSIVIEVGDDGRGLDRNRILAKAIERGLVAADQALDDGQVFRLILEPGFSTAQAVTDLSGRGVGMDVVKSSIEALRGSIDIESVAGEGTTLRLTLPLTLAIIDGFLVDVGGAQFVLPLEMVEECIELPAEANGEREYLDLRGRVLPFLRLRDLFEVPQPAPRRQNVVVVSHAGSQAGLAVDALMGECQTVIKPLGRLFEKLRGITGSTILPSGEVGLILDVPQLIQLAAGRESARLAQSGRVRLTAS